MGTENNGTVLKHEPLACRVGDALHQLRPQLDEQQVIGGLRQDLFGGGLPWAWQRSGASATNGGLFQTRREVSDRWKSQNLDCIADLKAGQIGGGADADARSLVLHDEPLPRQEESHDAADFHAAACQLLRIKGGHCCDRDRAGRENVRRDVPTLTKASIN